MQRPVVHVDTAALTHWMVEMAKTKSKKQVGFLLSGGSPLTSAQKSRLRSELHSGVVKVKAKPKKKRK